MQLLRRTPASAPRARRGSALLLAFLVLIVLAAILFQLYIGTTTDARVARNDVTLTAMDQAIESALLEVYDRLIVDAESAAASGAAAGAAPGGAGGDAPADPAGAPGAQQEPADSREDSWGQPQRTTINDVELRILVQDEDSKLNVLAMLTEDEEEAEKAFERVVRVLDLCREDTSVDIDRSDARRLADAMREHMRSRETSLLPRPTLLSDDEEEADRGLPLTLREMVVLDPFGPGYFRDYRDDRGRVVHSIGSYLTVWTSLKPLSEVQPPEEGAGTGQPGDEDAPGDDQAGSGGAPAGGDSGGGGDAGGAAGDEGGAQPQPGTSGASVEGVAVNINTAPAAVLKSLMDDRDVAYRFWDEVIEYRNLEEEDEDGDSDETEPIYDEFGNELFARRFFDSLAELEELGGWDDIQAEARAELQRLIGTQSRVFSIYVSARRATGQEDAFGGVRGAPLPGERQDQKGNAITRTVRSVVWRYQDGDAWKIVPVIRWEVLDYTPFEVLDFPDPDR